VNQTQLIRLFAAVVLVLRAGAAGAQGAPSQQAPPPPPVITEGGWEFEVHGGVVSSTSPSGGVTSLPTTASVVSGLISASTFYAGLGTQLFNQNQAAAGSAPTITALDPVLSSPAIQWEQWATTVGGRLTRLLNQRFAIEASAAYQRTVLTFNDEALAGIEATRASFVPAVTRALASPSIPSEVTSVATLTDWQSAPRLLATGALVFNLRTNGKAIPYIVGGGGAVLYFGETPNAALVGTYRFGASSQVTGTDTVFLQYSMPERDFVPIAGGGLKYYASRGWGLRLDGRAQFVQNRISNLVSTTPARALRTAGSPFPVITAGALQFSSTAPLSGSTFTEVTTFTGTDYQVWVAVTAGFFLRF
jgi:hypothetical protein